MKMVDPNGEEVRNLIIWYRRNFGKWYQRIWYRLFKKED